MAEATFNDVLEEQKKTTGLLGSLGATLKQQVLGDKAGQKTDDESLTLDRNDDKRQGSMLKVAVAQLAGFMLMGKKEDQRTKDQKKLDEARERFNKQAGVRKVEEDEDNRSFLAKTYGKLGDKFKDGWESVVDSLKKFKTVATTGLLAFLGAVGLFALAEFLQSETWKKIREWIKENPIKGVLATLLLLGVFFAPLLTLRLAIGAIKLFTISIR